MASNHRTLLVEVAWEVCNQVGGIYTVIRSKTPTMVNNWAEDYCLVGPLIDPTIITEIDPITPRGDIFGRASERLRKKGFDIIFGRWLISGRPKVVLINPKGAIPQLDQIKSSLYENYQIRIPENNELVIKTLFFTYLVTDFFKEILGITKRKEHHVIGHFHEWMSGSSILDIKKQKLLVKTVFTTHATLLGRHLAMYSPQFYDHLPFFKWKEEADKFNILPEVSIERTAAHNADVFTTVSEVTARECKHLLKRKPDQILPNGLNIERFEVVHQPQVLHAENKEELHRFVMGHFFQSYSFDLENTLYFFTSGRYEYKNKGFDLTLEGLYRLNELMKKKLPGKTVVMFFVTKRPFYGINAEVLHSRALLDEIKQNVHAIQDQVGKRLFNSSTTRDDHRLPELNQFVDDYWRLRYRRTIQAWKTIKKPTIVTHDLKDPGNDEILNFLHHRNMMNDEDDRVKIVYHPDFISPANPLFGLEYHQFVRGCHLGIFPSYYEPWGYTPLECIAREVPAITSDLAGFGDYVKKNISEHEKKGVFIVERGKKTFDDSAEHLANILFNFVKQSRRERIAQRNLTEAAASQFDWQYLIEHYEKALKA